MPKLPPKTLRPYIFHGVGFSWDESQGRAKGDCPFCDSDKFSVEVETGLYRCWSCDEGGNHHTFVRNYHAACYRETRIATYEELREDRGLVYAETLMQWGVCRCRLTDRWLIPGYDGQHKMRTLYVKGGKVLYPTPEMGSWIFAPTEEFRETKSWLLVGEGLWDAASLFEVLANSQLTERGFQTTANGSTCLDQMEIIGIPGCGSVGRPMQRWLNLCHNRNVVFFFDNDHPKQNGHQPGLEALRRAVGILRKSQQHQPLAVYYDSWGRDGWNPESDDGRDIRDELRGV